MAGNDPIVISDSDSDTLSESERPTLQSAPRAKAELVKTQTKDVGTNSAGAASLVASVASSQTEAEGASTGSSAAAGPSAGLLSLLPDRRQLERERMERARKRRREQNLTSSSSEDDEPKRAKTSDVSRDDVSIRQQPFLSARAEAQEMPINASPSSSNKQRPTQAAGARSCSKATDPIESTSRFWTGTVKHGYNKYADRSLAGVSTSQMLLPATASSRNGLQLAVLATYDLRIDWLYSLFPRGLPVTLVVPPPKEDYRTDSAVARPGLHPSEIFDGFSRCPGWQICVPNKPKGGWLTQHMKFLFLVHQDFLRIAILSGNLNEIDWERIENTAYIQDFPLVADATKTAGPSSSKNDFKAQLLRVLRSLSMPTSHAIYAALDRFDFSQATRARIVASWPEASSLAEWDRIETQGLGRLGKVVRDFGIKGPLDVECQGSSLANHDIKWIEHFHLLASGVNPRRLLPLKGKPNETHSDYFRASGRKVGSLPPIKICFPSHRYVEERTVEGPMGALSFFGKAETFASSS